MNPLHELDQDEFNKYPAPLWEVWMKMHTSHINATLPNYGPMLYWFTRGISAKLVVEIGVAEGYTSFFLANAVQDVMIRQGETNYKYIGIDTHIRAEYTDPIKNAYSIAAFWEMNSLDVTPNMFNEQQIDLIFQDGCHDTDHCLKELELFYPLLKDKGNGYIIMHDVHYLCEEYFEIVRKDNRYKFEYVRMIENYGLAICRKMDNYNYEKKTCPEAWIL